MQRLLSTNLAHLAQILHLASKAVWGGRGETTATPTATPKSDFCQGRGIGPIRPKYVVGIGSHWIPFGPHPRVSWCRRPQLAHPLNRHPPFSSDHQTSGHHPLPLPNCPGPPFRSPMALSSNEHEPRDLSGRAWSSPNCSSLAGSWMGWEESGTAVSTPQDPYRDNAALCPALCSSRYILTSAPQRLLNVLHQALHFSHRVPSTSSYSFLTNPHVGI